VVRVGSCAAWEYIYEDDGRAFNSITTSCAPLPYNSKCVWHNLPIHNSVISSQPAIALLRLIIFCRLTTAACAFLYAQKSKPSLSNQMLPYAPPSSPPKLTPPPTPSPSAREKDPPPSISLTQNPLICSGLWAPPSLNPERAQTLNPQHPPPPTCMSLALSPCTGGRSLLMQLRMRT